MKIILNENDFKLSIDEAEILAKNTDYANDANEEFEQINYADAAAFFLEGYNYLLKKIKKSDFEVNEIANICNIIKKNDEENNWIFIDEDNLPEIGTEFLLKNEKWINEDYNPLGIRLGFRCDLMGWVSSYYCNEHDEYHTRYSDEDNYDFELSKGDDQIPTHYKKIM